MLLVKVRILVAASALSSFRRNITVEAAISKIFFIFLIENQPNFCESFPPQPIKQLTPAEIVKELDTYIIGQDAAKRAVAIALRNRWRRQQVEGELRDEIYPNNIILIGPTGVGKTELARRLANLAGAPFIKVEASKYTEVGYVGRDVESMIRDLVDTAVAKVKAEQREALRGEVETAVEERLLDLLLPPRPKRRRAEEGEAARRTRRAEQERRRRQREKLRLDLMAGLLEAENVELDVPEDSDAADADLLLRRHGRDGHQHARDAGRPLQAHAPPPRHHHRSPRFHPRRGDGTADRLRPRRARGRAPHRNRRHRLPRRNRQDRRPRRKLRRRPRRQPQRRAARHPARRRRHAGHHQVRPRAHRPHPVRRRRRLHRLQASPTSSPNCRAASRSASNWKSSAPRNSTAS